MDRVVAGRVAPVLGRARTRAVEVHPPPVGNGASSPIVPARWEWGIAVVALFILGRWPVLFLRTRLLGPLGPIRWPDWQYDPYVRVVFITTEVVVALIAARRLRPRTLLRQPFLIALVTLAWASTIWSVEPGVTIWRALTLIGATAVGWYVGERFDPAQIAVIVASVAAIGAAASLLAVAIVPRIATYSGRTPDEWSGIYYNRNELALVLSAGILASAFLMSVPGRARIAEVGTILAELFLLMRTGARTAPMALAGALVVCALAYGVRRVAKGKLTVRGGAVACVAIVASGLAMVSWQWKNIVAFAGRNLTLSHRTVIWMIDRAFIARRPWTGWGFEAIWSNRVTSAEATRIMGQFPYSSHNGYYEIAVGVGWLGLFVLGLFLAVTFYRAFVYAWRGRDVASLWPLGLVVFVLTANFTESLFVSSEAFWALIVASAFVLSRTTTILVRRPNQ